MSVRETSPAGVRTFAVADPRHREIVEHVTLVENAGRDLTVCTCGASFTPRSLTAGCAHVRRVRDLLEEQVEAGRQRWVDATVPCGRCAGRGFVVDALYRTEPCRCTGGRVPKTGAGGGVITWIECSTQADVDKALAVDPKAFIRITGTGYFRAYDSATVDAYGSATVRAYGSATVRAYGSATVDAYDSATVDAYGSATVRAYDSATVRAYGSATVRAYDSATVDASPYVAIHDHGGPTITGGVIIKVPKPATAEEWCEYRGVEIKDGKVVLFKAVRDDYRSSYRFSYEPGTVPVAPDWDGGKAECGGGLHFCATVHEALGFDPEATRIVACPVALKDIAVHKNARMPHKVKARGCCDPVWEVDVDGERLAVAA